MSDTYELSLTLTKNGLPLQGLTPINKRITVAQSQQVSFTRGSGFGALPIAQIPIKSLFLFQGDQIQTLDLGDITCNPGGIVLLFNATPAADPPTLTHAAEIDSQNTVLAGGT